MATWETEPKSMVPGGGWIYDSENISYDDLIDNELAPVKYDGIGTTTVWTTETKTN